jgi:chromosome segregation ATPase
MEDEMIEMLVLEGFGKIVEAPNHEKIAVILADRAKLLEDLDAAQNQIDSLKKQAKQSSDSISLSSSSHNKNDDMEIIRVMQADKIRLCDKIDLLESEIEIIRSTNSKLSHQINDLRTQYDELSYQNTLNLNRIRDLSKENEELKAKQILKDNKSDLEEALELSKLELSKISKDNSNLKEEIDKLYDEIGSFEVENRQLKLENKNFKQEIETLNNELDELMQFKANYERLKIEYDKLHASLKHHDKLLNEKLTSPRIQSPNSPTNLTPSCSFKSASKPENLSIDSNNKTTPQLELEWIRGENEKLLLDLEKVQSKLNSKIEQYSQLKEQLEDKNQEMKVFIEKCEKQQTVQEDFLSMQKRIIDLEHELSAEKEDRLKDLDQHEEKMRDLLKKNDQLWSQANNAEQNYKSTMHVIQEQVLMLENQDSKLREYLTSISTLQTELSDLYLKKEGLESKLTDMSQKHDELCKNYDELNQLKQEENQSNKKEIVLFNSKLSELNKSLKRKESKIQDLQLEITSLNKEKVFIISQNENNHTKVMQDMLSLQEKFTDVNFKFKKLREESEILNQNIKEKNEIKESLERNISNLKISLKQESIEKNDTKEKNKQLEVLIAKVRI